MQSSNKLIGLCHGLSVPAAAIAEFKLMLSTGVASEANMPETRYLEDHPI